MLQERKDQSGQLVTNNHDVENHLIFCHDASGLTTPSQTFVDTHDTYDDVPAT